LQPQCLLCCLSASHVLNFRAWKSYYSQRCCYHLCIPKLNLEFFWSILECTLCNWLVNLLRTKLKNCGIIPFSSSDCACWFLTTWNLLQDVKIWLHVNGKFCNNVKKMYVPCPKGWKHTTPLKNCGHKNKNFAFGFFFVDVDITSWILFAHFKYIALALDLETSLC